MSSINSYIIKPFSNSTNPLLNYSRNRPFNHAIVHSFIHSIIQAFYHSIILLLKLTLPMLLALISLKGVAQQNITLQMCHENADSLYPLAFQKDKLAAINTLELEKLKSEYYPSLNLNMKFSYQSKVTEVPIPAMGLDAESPIVPHEQFGATVDLNQILYDGGTIKNAKNVNQIKTKTEIQQVEVDMYRVKEQITQIYFLCLILQENQKIIELTLDNIFEQRNILVSSVENGVINASELDNLDAETLKLEQQIIDINSQKKQALKALSKLSCIEIGVTNIIETPSIGSPTDNKIFRPEHLLFNQQTELLDANIKLTNTQRLPKVMAFGSAGMGYPGLNMFSGELEPYYIVGAQLKWNIWDWKQTRRSKQQLSLQKQIITDNKNNYNKNLGIKLSDAEIKTEKLQQLIIKDLEIISLRKKITKRSASQLENGTINSADYLMDVNAEKQAHINLKSREIQLIQCKIDLHSLAGKNLFTNKN